MLPFAKVNDFTGHFFFLNWEDADFSGEEDGEALPEMKLPGKIGTKKLKRIQEKAEKKAMREVGDWWLISQYSNSITLVLVNVTVVLVNITIVLVNITIVFGND